MTVTTQLLHETVDGRSLTDEEVLRIDDPFVANRRRATRDVQIGGRTIPAGDRVLLNWTAANRDPLVFGDPDEFRPEENARQNLVFGAGPHRVPRTGSHPDGAARGGHRAAGPHRPAALGG